VTSLLEKTTRRRSTIAASLQGSSLSTSSGKLLGICVRLKCGRPRVLRCCVETAIGDRVGLKYLSIITVLLERLNRSGLRASSVRLILRWCSSPLR
jgi:hypothetical protein